jgi:hypothetical protein
MICGCARCSRNYTCSAGLFITRGLFSQFGFNVGSLLVIYVGAGEEWRDLLTECVDTSFMCGSFD